MIVRSPSPPIEIPEVTVGAFVLRQAERLADKPANLVFAPKDRDKMWLKLFGEHRGQIDADFGFKAFTTPPLAAAHSCDARRYPTRATKAAGSECRWTSVAVVRN